jgi:hypothetical protein
VHRLRLSDCDLWVGLTGSISRSVLGRRIHADDVRPAVVVVLLAVALLAAAAGCGGGSEKAARSVPVGFVGVTASQPLLEGKADINREAPTMASAGVESLRMPFYWSNMQPYRSLAAVPAKARSRYRVVHGVPTDFGLSDRFVEAAARHGISIFPAVLGTPPWAARHPGSDNSPPAGTAPYADFLRVLIERYGPKGSFWGEHPGLARRPIREWQIWNEPDHLQYWTDQPFARAYVRLLRAARTAVHAADPGAKVVLAGFANRSWDLLAQVYAAGGRGAFDIAAIHPYTLQVANVMRIIRYARAVMTRNGDRSPLMLTEITWSSAAGRTQIRFGYETTEAGQASRLAAVIPQIVRERKQLGIARFHVETWITEDRGPSPIAYGGLRELEPSGAIRDKPAFAAYRRVARQLEGCAKTSNASHCR